MVKVQTASHRGHESERILAPALGAVSHWMPRTMEDRGSSPDGAMTCGTQPTHIRGINRRWKVPVTRCS